MKSISQSHAKKFFSAFAFFVLLFFTSCEGFFSDNNLEQKIKAAIDYANAPVSTFVVSADSNAGTIIPSGQVQYKPTDLQNIEFTCKPGYEFIRWSFTYKMISQGEGSPTLTTTDPDWWKEYVEIVKDTKSEPNSKGEVVYSLQIKFIKATENLLIEPICSLKPEIKNFYPAYNLTGESRERQLSFEFNTDIDESSFIYSSTELAGITGITTTLKNENNQIYGYVKDGKTFFKNIEILFSNDDSNINDCYQNVLYKSENKTLFITPDKSNPVEFPGTVAEIKICFSEGIKSKNGASITETTKIICLNKETNRKARIAILTDKGATPNYQDYSVGIRTSITFTETESIQFLYWTVTGVDSASTSKIVIEPDEDNSKKITFFANDTIEQSEEVIIKAVYESRPDVYSWLPSDANTAQPKDSEIKITFTTEISLESFKQGYNILCNGNGVKDLFNDPVYDKANGTDNKKIIKISPKEGYWLDVQDDDTKVVSVIIPETVYYEKTEADNETYRIKLGKEKVITYTIGSSTRNKVYVQFTVTGSTGSIENFNTSKTEFNLGETISLKFKENSDYTFLGWNQTAGTEEYVEIIPSVENPLVYTFKMKKAFGTQSSPISVNANCVEKLKVTDFKVNNAAFNTTTQYPKNSNYTITFNHNLAQNDCNVQLVLTGVPVEDYFDKAINNNVITLTAKNNKRLSINTLQTMVITIDSQESYGFYYSINDENIYLNKTYKYNVLLNETTTQTASVQFNWDDTKGKIVDSNGNTLSKAVENYSLDQVKRFRFVPNSNYDFVCWKITGSANDKSQILLGSANDINQNETYITINGSTTETVTIEPYCSEKLKIADITINGSHYDKYAIYPQDSDVVITFNKPLNLESSDTNLRGIKLSCGGRDYTVDINDENQKFFSKTLSGNSITLHQLDPDNFIGGFSESLRNRTVRISFITSQIYYKVTSLDETTSVKLYLEDNSDFDYTISCETVTKIRVEIHGPSNSVSSISIKGQYSDTLFSRNTETYDYNELYYINVGEPIKITYYPIYSYKATGLNIYYYAYSGNTSLPGKTTIRWQDYVYEATYTPEYKTFYSQYAQEHNTGGMSITFKADLKPCITDVTMSKDGFIYTCDTPIVMNFSQDIKSNTIILEQNASQTVRIRLPDGTDITNYYAKDSCDAATDQIVIRPKVSIRQLFEERAASFLCAKIEISHPQIMPYNSTDGLEGFESKEMEAYYLEDSNAGFYEMEYYSIPFYISKDVSNLLKPYDTLEVKNGDNSSIEPDVVLFSYDDFYSNEYAASDNSDLHIKASYSTNQDSYIQGNWSQVDFSPCWNTEIVINPLFIWDNENYVQKAVNKSPLTIKLNSPGDPTINNSNGSFWFDELGYDIQTVFRVDIRYSNTACGNVQTKSYYMLWGYIYD